MEREHECRRRIQMTLRCKRVCQPEPHRQVGKQELDCCLSAGYRALGSFPRFRAPRLLPTAVPGASVWHSMEGGTGWDANNAVQRGAPSYLHFSSSPWRQDASLGRYAVHAPRVLRSRTCRR